MHNLAELFQKVHGGTFVGIDTLTVVPLTGGKKNPMQDRVTKRVTNSSVMVFQNKNFSSYDAMVKRRLVAEGKSETDFELSPRKWGERVPNLPIVYHVKDGQDKYYIEVIFLKAGTVEYFLDNQPIRKEDIEGLKEAATPDQGGLENSVIIRSYAVDSLVAIRLDHNEYQAPFMVDFS